MNATIRFMIRYATALMTFAVVALPASRAQAEETPAPAPAARTVVLVRHGNYVPDEADSSPGPGLSPVGIAQAKLVAARLAGMPGKFDAIFSSPMTRAHDTAKVIAADLPGVAVEVLPELEECTPATRRKEVTKDEKPEAMAACAARLDTLFAKRFVPAQDVERRELFVCHGNVTRYLVTRALGVDSEAWLEMSVGHASLTQIRIEADGRYKVISIGDIGHIPPNLQTGATGMADKKLAISGGNP